jgi:hypothetical protein
MPVGASGSGFISAQYSIPTEPDYGATPCRCPHLNSNSRSMRMILIASVGLLIAACGCGPLTSSPPVVLGSSDWRIPAVGGPLELRPLPPPENVCPDYEQWLRVTSEPVARIYEATLRGASNQTGFVTQTIEGDTPMGMSVLTQVTFSYHSENGAYTLHWARFGRHNTDFLKLGDSPKKVWLQYHPLSRRGKPEFSIMAFEGLKGVGCVVAGRGTR